MRGDSWQVVQGDLSEEVAVELVATHCVTSWSSGGWNRPQVEWKGGAAGRWGRGRCDAQESCVALPPRV